MRHRFEAGFGADLSRVRLHDDRAAQAGAALLRARAFTRGADISFARGAFAPGTRQGDRLLAHELAHAVAHEARKDDTTIHRAVDETAACGDHASDRAQVQTGSKGPSVAEAQCRLNDASVRMQEAGEPPLPETPLAVDADFGTRTHNAVVAFQRHVFPVAPDEWDGIVGPKTWAALDAAVTGERGPPAYCPTGTSALEPWTFAGEPPGMVPCGGGGAGGKRPPPLKQIMVTIQADVTGDASSSQRPHLHLGLPKRMDPENIGILGAHFLGEVADGGPGTGGEIVFSQVVRDSHRRIRVGTDLAEERVTNALDHDAQFGTARMPVGPGRNPPLTSGDTPGSGIDTKKQKARFSFNFRDKFELFLMWRPESDSATGEWLSYGSVQWEWFGVATGVSADSPLNWIDPIEPFEVCDSVRKGATRTAPAKGATVMPVKSDHLGFPVNVAGNSPLVWKPAFKDPVAREKDLDAC